MKPKVLFVGVLLSIIFVFGCDAKQRDFHVLIGPYLGQNPQLMLTKIQTSLEKREIIEFPNLDNRQKDLIVEIAETLEEWFPEQLKSLNIPGAAVSVFDNNNVIWEKTYGHIGRDNSFISNSFLRLL
jgi:hypothetical protein